MIKLQSYFDLIVPFALGVAMFMMMMFRFWQLKNSAKHFQNTANSALTMRVILILVPLWH
jgi:hypothetical protein